MGLLAVMEPTDPSEVVQPRGSAFGERHDMVDLESGTHLAPRHDTSRIPRLERGSQVRGDRAARVRNPSDLDAVPLEDLDEPISRHPTSHSHGNGTDTADDAPLTGFDAPPFEGRAIDFDVDDGTRGLISRREAQQRVGRIGVGSLALSGAARFDLQALRAGLNGGDQLRPIVGREAPVQPNGAVWIGPMTKVPTPADALTRVLVGVSRGADLSAAIAKGRDGL
jgi:hypothetical protein